MFERLIEIIERKFLNDRELLELEDNEFVLSCKFVKPHNAHYNEYTVIIKNKEKLEEHTIYLKHR